MRLGLFLALIASVIALAGLTVYVGFLYSGMLGVSAPVGLGLGGILAMGLVVLVRFWRRADD